MRWINSNIKWIMLLAGALTCTMVYNVIDPQAGLQNTFGESLNGDLAQIVVRSWGALITLIGAMLIYGAFNPPQRAYTLVVAGSSKLIFVGLILVYGQSYLSKAGLALVVDTVMVVLFSMYLLSARKAST